MAYRRDRVPALSGGDRISQPSISDREINLKETSYEIQQSVLKMVTELKTQLLKE
ncbi:hypothetical protein GXM_01379 [Nostoc sphaeroides CCNUC1]|uniref:Uncharacterized protein n=1 Tax=Nostoc sphaeroides CCNUC1 TaxID=2653204 RepID=A0A5P8VUT3_9NOSO|nr:hypothetical protein GXM_01379 [Nostoc sphaeroides CCNUC1]